MVSKEGDCIAAAQHVVQPVESLHDCKHLFLICRPELLRLAKLSTEKCKRFMALLSYRLSQLPVGTLSDSGGPLQVACISVDAQMRVWVAVRCFDHVLQLSLKVLERSGVFFTPSQTRHWNAGDALFR